MQNRLSVAVGMFAMLFAAGPATTPITVQGRVTDAATGAPLSGASVMIPSVGLSSSTTTGRDGSYRMSITPAGIRDSVAVMVRRIGYRPRTASVAIAGRQQIQLDFALQKDANALSEVVVTGVGFSGKGSAVRLRTSAAPAIGIRQPREQSNTEGYAVIDDNPFLLAKRTPLSTFSVDVDRASYSNVRRFIRDGRTPPKDAVRIEELINYFPYDYAEPRGADPVSITGDVGAAPWNPAHRLVRIGLKARSIATESLPENNLVFLIDVSGSMGSPDKLPLVKNAFELLVNQLRPRDRVAIVVYAGAAGLVLPSTSGDRKGTILEALSRLESGGSTAGGAGLRLAYNVARENFIRRGNNRVILASDGDFNVGPSSDAEMVRLIEEERKSGVFLSVLGFGTGNVKDSKMEQMADRGNGNFAYIDNLLEAKKVFVSEFGATLRTVAKDVKLQVEFNPARVAAYRLIGYENRLLADSDFEDDKKDAGDMGSGHTVTALYEVIPVGSGNDSLMPKSTDLRYAKPTGTARSAGKELLYVKLRYKEPDGSKSSLMSYAVNDDTRSVSGDFAFASAVAEYGMMLRESKYRGAASYESVIVAARKGQGKDSGGLRAEFVSMVERTERISKVAAR